jgi:hypothetical protein
MEKGKNGKMEKPKISRRDAKAQRKQDARCQMLDAKKTIRFIRSIR